MSHILIYRFSFIASRVSLLIYRFSFIASRVSLLMYCIFMHIYTIAVDQYLYSFIILSCHQGLKAVRFTSEIK